MEQTIEVTKDLVSIIIPYYKKEIYFKNDKLDF